jgi:hypothetical protein
MEHKSFSRMTTLIALIALVAALMTASAPSAKALATTSTLQQRLHFVVFLLTTCTPWDRA